MNIQILARRKAIAMARIKAAVDKVQGKYYVPGEIANGLTATSKDADVEAMQRMEAVADLMEFLGSDYSGALVNEPEVPYLLDLPFNDIVKGIKEETNPVVLQDLLNNETSGKNRKGVVKALMQKMEGTQK